MRILVTGNMGYIGTVLVDLLKKKSYEIIGYDVDYFRYCNVEDCVFPSNQFTKDIRDICLEDLSDIEAVIHLAGLSNDPLGELAPQLTEQINYNSSIKLARLSKEVGVKRFIYASSQSMYGISDQSSELDEDDSLKKPITTYARTKWLVEEELTRLASDDFITVSLRPSTVFGASPRLRCDIVFNNFVACAYTTGRIEIKSDGTPWRPVVHVCDVSNAFIAALEAPAQIVNGQAFNVGTDNGNYTVRDLANAAQNAVPGSEVVFTKEHGSDARTYKVCFKKILRVLKDYYKPQWDLDQGGKELTHFFKKINLTEAQFRGPLCNRLNEIKYLILTGKVNGDLRWNN